MAYQPTHIVCASRGSMAVPINNMEHNFIVKGSPKNHWHICKQGQDEEEQQCGIHIHCIIGSHGNYWHILTRLEEQVTPAWYYIMVGIHIFGFPSQAKQSIFPQQGTIISFLSILPQSNPF